MIGGNGNSLKSCQAQIQVRMVRMQHAGVDPRDGYG